MDFSDSKSSPCHCESGAKGWWPGVKTELLCFGFCWERGPVFGSQPLPPIMGDGLPKTIIFRFQTTAEEDHFRAGRRRRFSKLIFGSLGAKAQCAEAMLCYKNTGIGTFRALQYWFPEILQVGRLSNRLGQELPSSPLNFGLFRRGYVGPLVNNCPVPIGFWKWRFLGNTVGEMQTFGNPDTSSSIEPPPPLGDCGGDKKFSDQDLFFWGGGGGGKHFLQVRGPRGQQACWFVFFQNEGPFWLPSPPRNHAARGTLPEISESQYR